MDSKMGEMIPEGQNYFNLLNGDETYPCSPENTAVFIHSDRFRDVDHLFVETDIDEGIFLFRSVFGVIFNPLVRDMENIGFHVQHADEPSDMDWQQYLKFHTKDVDKYWKHLKGTGGKAK